MARTPFKEKWYLAMRKKLGVKTNAEVRAYMKKQAKKSRRNWQGTGYFAQLKRDNPDKLKELSREAAIKKHSNRS